MPQFGLQPPAAGGVGEEVVVGRGEGVARRLHAGGGYGKGVLEDGVFSFFRGREFVGVAVLFEDSDVLFRGGEGRVGPF